MLVTEKEARTMRCVRMAAAIVTLSVDVSAKNAALVSGGQNCIGAKCMSWRWRTPELKPAEIQQGAERRGYCGESGPQANSILV